MKRIAVLFEGKIDYRMGGFNAVINRVKYLRAISDYQIDVYMISVYDRWFTRMFRGEKSVVKGPSVIDAEGVLVKMWWVSRFSSDSIRHHLFHGRPNHMLKQLYDLADNLKDYDLVSAHDRYAAHVARAAHDRYGIPFFITWHGASIYTDPVEDPMLKTLTVDLLQRPADNFFVSKGLVDKARELTSAPFPYDVLYNGASKDFYRYDDERRAKMRRKWGVEGRKCVAFVGRCEHVKNVQMLPDIFNRIASHYQGKVKFWAIGGGSQFQKLKREMGETDLEYRLMETQLPELMPALMNCVDVLVLPSNLEGLPLVTLEAIACGANAVASDVVGNAEGIGKENAIPFDDNFVDNIAQRAVEMLEGKVQQQIPAECSWEATAKKELEIYQKYLEK